MTIYPYPTTLASKSEESRNESHLGDATARGEPDVLMVDFRVNHDCFVINPEVALRIASRVITRTDTQRLKDLSFQDQMKDVISQTMSVRIYPVIIIIFFSPFQLSFCLKFFCIFEPLR